MDCRTEQGHIGTMRLKTGVAMVLPVLLILHAGCAGRRATRPVSDPVAPATRTTPASPAPIYHSLERGETLYTLARLYDVPLQTLLEVNGITDPTTIPDGTQIFIPGASRRLSYPSPAVAALAWPLTGPITGRFGRRGQRSRHTGLDIDAEHGAAIRAAASGRVVKAGSSGRYGKMVLLEHGNDLQTLYAHASRLLVRKGQWVEAGDRIAEVGSTGNARGTHLHFEVRYDGNTVDPLPYLNGGLSRTTDR